AALDGGIPTGFFDGQIDEVTLYPQVLSAAQINAIFSAGSAGKYPDVTPPVIACPMDLTADCNTWTNLSLMGRAIAMDDCDPAPMVTFSDSQVIGPLGKAIVSRTWTAMDCWGSTSTCTQTITMVDTTAPVLTCPSNRTVAPGTGWSFDTPTALDSCDGTNVIIRVVSTVTNGLQATRTWEALDSRTNRSSCSQTISFVDAFGPLLTILSPGDGEILNGSVTVSGVATDAGRGDSGISSVRVNGVPANGGTASGADTAHWSQTLTLNPGLNTITVEARDNNPDQN